MSGLVEGKVALITGAARGQGRSHAVRLAGEGADIIALDLCGQLDTVHYPMGTTEDLEETVRLVEEQDRRIVAQQADVRDFEALSAVVEAGLAEFGHIDIVSANAGIGIQEIDRPTWKVGADRWRDTIDINLTGVWHTVKAAVPSMVERGEGGSIILTSSAAGLKGMEQLADYVAAKHGIVGLMRTLAQELATHWIRVNSVHPTGVKTGMIENEAMEAFVAANPAMAQNMTNLLPIDAVDPIDISNAVLWLASDQARYVTGVALPVDAGITAK